MSLVAPTWSAALFADLAGKGFVGSRLMDFTDAVANGSVIHVVGKSFTTTDVGTVPGAGTGSGTGITSILEAIVASTIFSTSSGSFGSFGSRLQDVADSVATILVAQMLTATLTSVHAPVFAGVGTVDAGSIPVVGPVWGLAIKDAAPTFLGTEWPNFSNAIGVGCAAGFAAATGSVTIVGSPSGSPSGGGGVGSGTIS